MSNVVSIQRAKSAPPCRLWDDRKTHSEGENPQPMPLPVTVEQAADLMQRDPADWTIPAAADVTLVKAEIKRRDDAVKAAAPGGGN